MAASTRDRETSDRDALGQLLQQKERDLELAAKIGQSLLEQNKELQSRNEFLEENLATSGETVVQLKHELNRRIELLRVYSHLDDDGDERNDKSENSLRRRIERISAENEHLRSESNSLRRRLDAHAEKERTHAEDIGRQLEHANYKIHQLQRQIAEKSEEAASVSVTVERLLAEIQTRTMKENTLMNANESLNTQLEEAIVRHDNLQMQMIDLQEEYTELRSMFSETEEELSRYRMAPGNARSTSVDSLYDSLASELENSDSGFSSTPQMSARCENNLRLELQAVANQKGSDASGFLCEAVDVPSNVLIGIAKKKIAIEHVTPAAPPQTPQSETASSPKSQRRDDVDTPTEDKGAQSTNLAEKTDEPKKLAADVVVVEDRKMLCDASTSTFVVDEECQVETSMKDSLIFENDVPSSSRPERPLGVGALRMEPVSKSPSSDSLDGYVAPKLGEPGVPGTRDLDFSLKVLKARRQNPARAGARVLVPPDRQSCAALFRSGTVSEVSTSMHSASVTQSHVVRRRLSLRTFDAQSARISSLDTSWTDYSIALGLEHQRQHSLGVGLTSAVKSPPIRGVLNRTEMSPTTSPKRLAATSPTISSGLATLTFNPFQATGGIVLRRGL